MTDTTNRGNSSLDTATLWAAQVASDLSYGNPASATALQWAVDSGYTNDLAAMTQAGWIEITPSQANYTNTDPKTNFLGIAFYKVVNGQAEVIIANRGTCQPADLLSDVVIALGQDPASDDSALAYYDAVVGWVSKHLDGIGARSFNVVETGHSLGGQEADYVMAAANANQPAKGQTDPVPETVTFDAPGIGPEAKVSTNTPDAVNLYDAGDLVHDAGGTYLGNPVVAMPALVSLTQSASTGAVAGAALSPPGMVFGALSNVLLQGVTNNHSLVAFGDYFQAHPLVASFSLIQYQPAQVSQGVYDQLSSYAADSVSSAESIYQQVFSGAVSGGATVGTAQSQMDESFVSTASSGGEVVTGSLGDVISFTQSGNGITETSNGEMTDHLALSAVGQLQSDSWSTTAGAGATGTDASANQPEWMRVA